MPIYVGNNKIKPNGIKEAYVGNNKVYSAKKYYYYIYFMKDGVKYYTKADTTNSAVLTTTNINEATAWDILSGGGYQITDPTSGNYWAFTSSGDRLILSTTLTAKYFAHPGNIFNINGTNIYYSYAVFKYYVKLKSDGIKLILEIDTANALTLFAEEVNV